jgi:hypothetical protein
MANTVIQLKFSTINDTPASLNVGEPAYSFTSNKLFIGDASNNAIVIGGKFYVDQQAQIFIKANAAFEAANNAADEWVRVQANSAFTAANSAGVYANSAYGQANTATTNAATAQTHANKAYDQANTATTNAATADSKAVSAGSYANSAYTQANTATSDALTASLQAGIAGSYANSAFVHANAAFESSNTKFSSSGGTVSGDVGITGNLTVSGTTTYINTDILTVEDSLIKLANNNTAGDVVDIGFYGTYNSGGQKYTGLARTAGSNNFFLFKGLTSDPSSNALASGSVTAANAATLIANVSAYSVTINGVDTATQIENAYSQANTATTNAATADAKAVTAGSYANSAYTQANTATTNAATAQTHANKAYDQANTATTNAATADAKAVTAGSYANSAFGVANSALSLATGTAGVANTDYTTITTTAGYYGNGATISSFTLEANGRISQANSTLIGISASQVTVGTLAVARGGTGAGSFTNNGVLLGQGTSAFATASSSTEGHVLTINASGVPTFSYLQGGTF